MLDPRLILAGEPVNVLGALQGGAQAAGLANDVARGNALAGVYRTQGPGILAGDAGALNALAGVDPMAALGVRNTIADNRLADASLELAREQGRREAAKWAAQQDAATVAQAAAQHAAMIKGAAALYAQGDRAGYEDWLRKHGEDPAKLPFDNFPAVMAGTEGALEVWEAVRPKAPEEPAAIQALRIRAREAGLTPGTPEYQSFMAEGDTPKQGFEMTTGPDGTTVRMGGGVSTRPLTVEEGKNSGFLLRAQAAEEVMTKYAAEGASLGGRFAEALPLGIGNYLQTPEYRQFEQARRNFINALLRRESGAVISPEEFQNAEIQYFPRPGDDPATIEQKRQNRLDAIEGLRIGSGSGAAQVDAVRSEQQAAGSADPVASAPPPEFLQRPDVQAAARLGVDPAEIWRIYQEMAAPDAAPAAPADDGGWTVIDGVRIREKR